MSRRGGPGGDQKEDKKDDQSGNIDEQELLSIVGEGQKPLETPARIHVIHFLTKAARDEEEKTLRAVARRNDGRFRQVKAEDY
jgi:hypothetical protein